MGPDDVFAYAAKLREHGIEEVEFEMRELAKCEDVLGADGHVLGSDLTTEQVACVTRIRLAPHWSPPNKPAEEPVFDADPKANALASAEYQRKRLMKEALELVEAEDRVRFAHTEGT